MLRKLIYLAITLVFGPAGFLVIKSSYVLNEPHIFAMFLFSGSLMILLALAGIIGLVTDSNSKSSDKA
jgi:hypothetical protein